MTVRKCLYPQEPYALLIRSLIQLVETQLHSPMHLDFLSAHTGFSKFHLHRIFRALTGMSLMDYARRRRLSESVSVLLDSEKRILDIADEFGFGYEQSYIRAFRRHFGISPGRVRRLRPALPLTERVDPARFTPIGADGILFHSSFQIKPGFLFGGFKHPVDLAENASHSLVTRLATEFFYERMPELPHVLDPQSYLGLVEYSGDPTFNWYFTGTQVRSSIGQPRDLETRAFPTHKYAVFTFLARHHPTRITWDEVSDLYAYIFRSWLPASSYLQTDPWHFESCHMASAREDFGEFQILVPVEMMSPKVPAPESHEPWHQVLMG